MMAFVIITTLITISGVAVLANKLYKKHKINKEVTKMIEMFPNGYASDDSLGLSISEEAFEIFQRLNPCKLECDDDYYDEIIDYGSNEEEEE